VFFKITYQQLMSLDRSESVDAGALHERERGPQFSMCRRLRNLGIARRELAVFGRERLLQRDRERTQSPGSHGSEAVATP
jgi:hypothetical protein